MTDLRDDLAALAPHVDLGAGRALFERRRDARRARRRAGLLGLGAVVGVTAAIAGIVLVSDARDKPSSIRVTSPSPTTTTTAPIAPVLDFAVIDIRQGSAPMGTLHAAFDQGGLGRLWSAIGFEGNPPAVDFTGRVVVSITIPDDACPPTLTGFDRDGELVTPVFVEPAGACILPLIPKTFVVAMAIDTFGKQFTLHLPANPTYGYDEQRLAIDVGEVHIDPVVIKAGGFPHVTVSAPHAACYILRPTDGDGDSYFLESDGGPDGDLIGPVWYPYGQGGCEDIELPADLLETVVTPPIAAPGPYELCPTQRPDVCGALDIEAP
jgi:hypothetical protein